MGNLVLLRFDEIGNDVLPADDAGNLAELAKTGAALPDLVDAAVGRGRGFTSANADGLQAQDVVPGATLITRDATVQVILSWDIDAAVTYGAPQTIYARGKGTGAAEYVGAGLELRVVNATLRIGELRWIWHDLAGNLKTQVGGHFQVPVGGFLMLSATRRWVSSSRVVLRYYLGDALLAEVESVDGELGGGTTGTSSVGARYTGAAWGRFLDGVIDELRVVDEELTGEEIAMTFGRITVEQPRGYQLIREMHDPGFPISQDPGSRAQRETRMMGDALGFAAAQAENIRENILPDRAYGAILTRWEAITKQPAKPGDDVDTRRRRVVGKIRQRRGVSIPGLGDALDELLDTDPENLEVVAFDQTMEDSWTSLNVLRWRHMPATAFSIASDALRMQSSGDRSEYTQWRTATQPIGGRGLGAKVLTKITPTTIANQGEVGVMLLDHGAQHAALLGLRNDAGTYRIVRTTVENGIAAAATNLAAPGLVPVWLLLEHVSGANFRARWSTVGASGPWTEATFTHARMEGSRAKPMGDVGMYGRTWSAAAANLDVAFDDTRVRAPNGTRPFRLYVVRDPSDPGAPDYLGANTVIGGLRQTHTIARVVRTMRAKYDNVNTSYDREPMGGHELVDPAPVSLTWTTDATSGMGVPATALEWADLLASAGVASGGPAALYLLQEASSNPQDSIGAKHLTASGTLAYQQAVTGWARKSIKTTGGVQGQLVNSAGYANVNAESKLVIAYVRAAAATAKRTIYRFGDVFDGDATVEETTTPRLQVGRGGTAARVAGASSPIGTVRPIVLRVQDTANLVDVFTDQEKIVGGAQGCSGTTLTFGGDNFQTWYPGDTDYLYAAVFTGASAELSDVSVKAILQTLGWTIPW